MTQNTQRMTDLARRVFVYDGHRFDDPGSEYTIEQVQNHLVLYFPAVAHAAVEEKILPDGTREITFRKQVARKGGEDVDRSKLANLLEELHTIPPYEDPLAELGAALGSGPISLAAILDARDLLQIHADQVFGLTSRTSRVVKRCLGLPPSPIHRIPVGF